MRVRKIYGPSGVWAPPCGDICLKREGGASCHFSSRLYTQTPQTPNPTEFLLSLNMLWHHCLFALLLNAIHTSSAEVNVTSVHLVFSHHLDVGLDLPQKITTDCVGFATNIVKRYFEVHIPRAIRIADELRALGSEDRLSYSVHAWIASLYVDCVAWRVKDGCVLNPAFISCPSPAAISTFDAAVRRGDIVYTDSPFNVNVEAADASLLEGITKVAGALDERYNFTEKWGSRVWSNIDVRGFARSSVPLLAKNGYGALYVGANGHPVAAGETPGLQPVVGAHNATMFMWRDPVSNATLPVIFHQGYGGYKTRPECVVSDNGVALASYIRTDNSGPPNDVFEVMEVYRTVRAAFPGASVHASSFQSFAAAALTPQVRNALPETTVDWGDVWLSGISTDPYRTAVFRAMTRARSGCVASGVCDPNSAELQNFTRFLAKNIEHTQGVQNEDWSPGIAGPNQAKLADSAHWSNTEFAKVHSASKNIFEMGDRSWIEAREFNTLARQALPDEHALAALIDHELQQLRPARPDTTTLKNVSTPIHCGNVVMAFSSSGAMTQLTLGADIAGSDNPLFDLTYVTYNKKETWDQKKNLTCSEAGCANPEDAVWRPQLEAVFSNASTEATVCRVVTHATFPTTLRSKYGAPSDVYMEHIITPTAVSTTLSWFGKTATRLPESFMLSFAPSLLGHEWQMDILGEWVGPTEVGNGSENFYNRGINSGVRYVNVTGGVPQGVAIGVVDAAMACPIVKGLGLLGDSSPMSESNPEPPANVSVAGMAVSLLHNLMPISGYNQWYPFGVGEYYQSEDESSAFRFTVSLL